MKKKKIVFLDRDGVINKDIGYLHKIPDFEFVDGILNALKYLQDRGFEFIIVTNQSGIARNYYTVEEYKELNNWILQKLDENNIKVLDVFYCPHGPDDNCSCRKPKPGLFFEAFEKYDIDIEGCWMIGDSKRDIEAAMNAGLNNSVLLSNSGKLKEINPKETKIITNLVDIPKFIY